jgi:hypothetical protein
VLVLLLLVYSHVEATIMIIIRMIQARHPPAILGMCLPAMFLTGIQITTTTRNGQVIRGHQYCHKLIRQLAVASSCPVERALVTHRRLVNKVRVKQPLAFQL